MGSVVVGNVSGCIRDRRGRQSNGGCWVSSRGDGVDDGDCMGGGVVIGLAYETKWVKWDNGAN